MIADPNANLMKMMATAISASARKTRSTKSLENTFPASDPVSVEQPTTSGRACRS